MENDYEEQAVQTGIIGSLGQNAASNVAAQYYLQEQEKGLAEAQLEVDSIKSEIYHLLRQDILEETPKGSGKFDWVKIKKVRERILSDSGVDRIMQVIHFYINKNTLLSNFDEKQINRLMLRFIREMNDLILLKYQLLFRQPTFEECKEIILEKIDDKKKMRMFAFEIMGKEFDEEVIKKNLLEEMEKTLETEMEKIRREQRKEKLRDYGLIIAQLEIMVYASLNRAYRGEERGSLRRHMNVNELIGGRPNLPQSSKGGIFEWGKK